MINNHADAATIQTESPGIRSIIKSIEDLPVLPAVAVQALTLSMNDDAALDQLSRVMESDSVLTARMLRLVNNVQTGLPSRIATVKQAVTLAGLNQVRCALLGVMIRKYLPDEAGQTHQAAKRLWTHSLMTAVMAHLVSQKSFPELQDQAFVGGLLHDIGKVVLQNVYPETYSEVVALQEEKNQESLNTEQSLLGVDHCLAGKILAQHWNLPGPFVDCIWLHHHRPEVLEMAATHREMAWIVSLANIMSREMFMQHPLAEGDNLRKSFMIKLKLEPSELESIRLNATREFEKKAVFFDLDGDPHVVFHAILQKANRTLSRMGLDLDVQRTALVRSNRLLDLTRKLSLGLGQVRTKEDLFHQVTQAFHGFSPVPLGIFYVVERETRELEGVAWTEGGMRRRLLCFTDRQGEPVWEHEDQSLPQDLRKLLSCSRQRRHFTESLCVTAAPPFHLFSFGLKGEYFAELCISVQQEYRCNNNEHLHTFLHVAHMLRSAMQTARLTERLHRNQEDLNQALWKNQQINKQIFDTERLAAVGQLAAGAAHEINNPLAIISARAQILELKEVDKKKKKELLIISQQIDRISKILSNLMDFARPAPPKLRDVDIHDVLDRVLELVDNGFDNRGIGVERKYDPAMVRIRADPNQLEQVFLNLVINARHAMEKAGGVLTVATALSKDKTTVDVQVADQGAGISRENMKRIFDPFFSTKEEGKGTGLGLSTSLGIVNSHFGKIDIDSTPGKGTVVSVILPVDITALRPGKAGDEALPSPTLSSRTKVLVVDDEEHIRDILKETLEGEDMIAVTANNGQEALRALAEEAFDLLLLDIKMPFCDGLSVLREVRKTDSALPVIVITGMASHEETEEAKSYGNCKCIRKPFHIKTLLAEVRSSLASVQ